MACDMLSKAQGCSSPSSRIGSGASTAKVNRRTRGAVRQISAAWSMAKSGREALASYRDAFAGKSGQLLGTKSGHLIRGNDWAACCKIDVLST